MDYSSLADARESNNAWSLDDTDDNDPPQRAPYSRVVLIAVAVLSAAVAIAVAVTTGAQRDRLGTAGLSTSVAPTTAPAEPLSAPSVLPQVPDARSADVDTRFIALVNAQGIRAPRTNLLFDAHHNCDRLRSGVSWTDMVNDLVAASTDLSTTQAAYFITTAVATYCPQ